MAYKIFVVEKWKKGANTANGNPVYNFALRASNGQVISGKTKPNAGFIYSVPDLYPGEKINAELSQTPSGRVYMTDFDGRVNPARRRKNPASVNIDVDVSSHNARGRKSKTAVKSNPTKRKASAIFKKANELMREGYERAQAFAVAYEEARAGKLKTTRKAPRKNPVARKLVSRPKPGGVRPKRKIYVVEMSGTTSGPWTQEGIFPTEAKAREYARALDAKHDHTRYIRVTV